MALSILLPPATQACLAAFTNAAYLQRVTVKPPAGAAIVWQGTGEREHSIDSQTITTPGGSSQAYTVDMEYSSNGGGSWQPSSVIPGGCVVGSLNLKVVISENHVDMDFNAVVQFMSWEPVS